MLKMDEQRLQVASQIGSNGNLIRTSEPVVINTWYHLEIKQVLDKTDNKVSKRSASEWPNKQKLPHDLPHPLGGNDVNLKVLFCRIIQSSVPSAYLMTSFLP